MEILNGINRDCKGLAGINKLYLFPYVKYSRSDIVVDDNLLLEFPSSELFEFETVGDVSFSEDSADEDGGKYYDINLSFKTKYFDEALKIVNKDVRAVVLDNNGNYRLLGNYNGLTCGSFNKTTGQGKADFNGLEFTFSGKELRESFFFTDLSIFDGEPTITLKTNSTSSTWSPTFVTNTGSDLIWEVSGGVTIPPTTINNPTFDLSGNTGDAIVTIKDVSNLTILSFNVGNNVNYADVSQAQNLYQLGLRVVSLETLILNNPLLEILEVTNNGSFSDLDISNSHLLRTLRLNSDNLSVLDISSNPNIDFLVCNANPLTPTATDNIVITLDGHELSNGTATIPSNRTSASDTAYSNLITKNWNIIES